MSRLQLSGVSLGGSSGEPAPPSPGSPNATPLRSREMKRTFSWSRKTASATRNSGAVGRNRSSGGISPPVETGAAGGAVVKRVFSFSRKAKPPQRQGPSSGEEHSNRSADGDIERTESLFSRTFSLRKGSGGPGASRPSNMALSGDDQHGSLLVRRVGKSREHKARYCVLYKSGCTFEWYFGSGGEPARDRRPDGGLTLAVASLDPRTPTVFYVQGVEGDTLECKAPSADEAQKWMAAFAPAMAAAISGYVLVQGKKGWKRRWVLFQPSCKKLCIYRHEPLVSLSAGSDAASHAQPGHRSHGDVQHAVPRPSPVQPFGFALFTPDGSMWELAVESASEMARWLRSMPIFDPLSSASLQSRAPTLPASPIGGNNGDTGEYVKPMATARVLHNSLVTALGQEYYAEKERRASRRRSSQRTSDAGSPATPRAPKLLGEVPVDAKGPQPVANGALVLVPKESSGKPNTEGCNEYGWGDSEEEEETDEEDGEEDGEDNPTPLNLGLTDRDLDYHQKPVLSLEKRRQIAVGGREPAAEIISASTPRTSGAKPAEGGDDDTERKGEASPAGETPRAHKLRSELEEMRAQLEALRNENRELKLQTGGERAFSLVACAPFRCRCPMPGLLVSALVDSGVPSLFPCGSGEP
jgi:hypothetical protein